MAAAVDLTHELSLVYDEFATGLLRYATSIIRDSDLAGEAVQETFLRYFLYRQQGQVIVNARAWLFKVLRNVTIDVFNKRSAAEHVPIEEAYNLGSGEDSALEKLELAALQERLTKLLSPRELECVQLRGEGLRYEEIAAALDVTVASVRMALVRAMEKLRRYQE